MEIGSFDTLTPDVMIDAVETAIGRRMSGLAAPLPSYINRVYEVQAMDGERLIAKFYRPKRWTYEAILEEHQFVLDCVEDEIPVIAPLLLHHGKTIGITDNDNFFVLYPKRFGRELEINQDEEWIRLGRVVARMHLAGSRATAPERIRLHPELSTANDICSLLEGGFIPTECQAGFIDVTTQIMQELHGLFNDIEYIRIHGDCHRANILERPGEGLMIIDFDDMMTGPPIQDLWLLLPGYAMDCQREIELIIEGYCEMRDFDEWTIRLIEPLRIMRLIYFLAWCAKQSKDHKFKHTFPNWGDSAFWRREIVDLHDQLGRIRQWQNTHSGNSVSVVNGIYSERLMTEF